MGKELTRQQRTKLDAQFEKWQQDLVNLTKRNKLLHFKHTKSSSLEITEPPLGEIARRLETNPWRFADLPTEDNGDPLPRRRENELRTTKRLAKEQLNSLKSLDRTSQQTWLDTGLWTLYLGFGMLKWRDPNEKDPAESPLLLQPVRLEREGNGQAFSLVVTEDDPVLNPALAIKLASDFDIQLPSIDELSDQPLQALDQLRAAVSGQTGWVIENRVVLTTFTFHKEAMYRDLVVNHSTIADHPLVQLAAVGVGAGAAEYSFTSIPDEQLDSVAPPEQLVSVRDADSTQRKCIVAARDGKSFVMNGPPGTGKSQTITNIIAELIHAGKSVLFVSEKMAALDVVANRLEEAGLSDFVLSLHSHKATRKSVVLDLEAALTNSPRATSRFSESDRANLLRLRETLNNYAIAYNEERTPLGQSMHQVVGRIVQLQSVPQAPPASAIDTSLTPESLSDILDAAERLGRAWRPVEERTSFLWRSLVDPQLSVSRQEVIRRQLTECGLRLEQVRTVVMDIDTALGLGWVSGVADATRLKSLLEMVESNDDASNVPATWLTGNVLEGVRHTLADRRQQIDLLRVLEAEVLTLGGPGWPMLPTGRADAATAAVEMLGADTIKWQFGTNATVSNVDAFIALRADVSDRTAAMKADAQLVAESFGMPLGRLTLNRIAEIAELTSFMGSATPPEPAWLSPFTQAALQEAVNVLTLLIDGYRKHRASLNSIFKEQVLDLELKGLQAQLSGTSGLAKLGGSYRAAKKELAATVISGKVTPEVIARLGEAVAWSEIREQLKGAETTHKSMLGRYYNGPVTTDLGRLERALHVAHRALELAGSTATAGLTKQLSVDGTPDQATVEAGSRLRTAHDEWLATVEPKLAANGFESATLSVDEIAAWLTRSHPSFETIATSVRSANSALMRDLSVTDAIQMLGYADRISVQRNALNTSAELDAALFGPAWNGADTDLARVDRNVVWAESVKYRADGPLSSAVAEALLGLGPTAGQLGASLDALRISWTAIGDLFETSWADHLTADFSVSFDDAAALLSDLGNSVSDIEVWSRFVGARSDLHGHHLDGVIDFLESSQLKGDDIARVIERSVLEQWADATFAADSRLNSVAPSERDHVVERFKNLDRALVANASAAVINKCSARRPTTQLGAAGLILREAQKRSRHLPIRDLIDNTREIVTLLKPCFMMSPLSVSQFLPPDALFDVVIFDEASQVKPADAMNCIYRGSQLIVAGDPKQLPPTSFFDLVAVESSDDYDETAPEDFESVLDIYIGSGLPLLSLDWHYRSQHEALITYSNYRFYDGRLHTFPGAIDVADDVGVALIQANGVYRRGGSRDNPIEAAKVVERVLFHRQHHPHLTLGVVAFSTAQESAIVAELDRQSSSVPEIAELMGSTDRLDGFFVRNLENVQGDERDIIIFSIGYGPDENGKFTEQLGPLGQSGGQRRLNVAITRARRRVEVVASITYASFPGTSSAEGVRHLQHYLEFAERGPVALAIDMQQGAHDTESVFEEQVVQTLQRFGFDAVPQVGVAGYRIDIGIRHPARPGEYVLGIECDGAAYHSSRVARDRDRLRQEILEGLGWRLHRIWGPSWFHDRPGQEAALRAAVTAAINARRSTTAPRRSAPTRPTVEVEEVDLTALPAWVTPYRVSGWAPSGWRNPNEIHAVAKNEFIQGFLRVLADEAPMHRNLLLRRVSEAYGARRIGDRIKEALDEALDSAIKQKKVKVTERDFVQLPDTTLCVRTVDPDDERSKRKVQQIPAAERQLAIESLVRDSGRVKQSDLLVAVGRLLGWGRIGGDIEAALRRDLRDLADHDRISFESNDTIALQSR